MTSATLPSWRPGATRDAIEAFLDQARDVPVEERLAVFDNDGTLWVERPNYVQLHFFLAGVKQRVDQDPGAAANPVYAALLSGDEAAIGELGLPRIGLALTELYEGIGPADFTAQVKEFMASAVHPTLGRPLRATVYQPMLELIEELRRRDFTVSVVTGGGTEFVRGISHELYGVAPELVVGTLIEYDFVREGDGVASIRRSSRLVGAANEGETKVLNIQTQLGRRPIFAAGNTDGDSEMMAWAASGTGPCLALLIDHDDSEREFRYSGHSATLAGTEPVIDTAARLGWTVASIANDWETVFGPA